MSKKSEKLYSDSPSVKRGKDGEMAVKKPSEADGEDMGTEGGDGAMPIHAEHDAERKSMHKRHEEEMKSMHERHAKDVSEMHKRHEKGGKEEKPEAKVEEKKE